MNTFLHAARLPRLLVSSRPQSNSPLTRLRRSAGIWATSLGLGILSMGLAPAQGQTVDGTEVVGYNNANDMDTLKALGNSSFTTFIDGFLEPTSASTAGAPSLGFDTLQYSATMDSARVSAFNALRAGGKKVLISFGGQGAGSSYATFANSGTYNGKFYSADQATHTLANILAAYVRGDSSYTNLVTGTVVSITTYDNSAGTFNGFDGIDLDFEDTQSFQPQNSPYSYDGVEFLTQLTIYLRKELGGNYVITHAPQTVYLDPAYTQGNTGTYGMPTGAYQAVLTTDYTGKNPDAQLTEAGQDITWLNVQFYNNPGDDGNNTVNGLIQAFENIVMANPGVPPSKFVLTLPIISADAGDNHFSDTQIPQVVEALNSWLAGRGEGTLAGGAGFQIYESSSSVGQTLADDMNFATAFVHVPPTFTSAATASAVQGKPFSFQVKASDSPLDYKAAGLPSGLMIDAKTGLISGSPKNAGTSAVTLTAANAYGSSSTKLTITITGVPAITSATTASATQNKAFSYQITASNSPTSYSVSGLPSGLTLNASTGLISGTPKNAGTAAITIKATNAAGTGSARLTITIQGIPAITSGTAAAATQGQPFSYQITASGNPTSFAAPGLPTGLTLDASTGLISGTPRNVGKAVITISATNATGTGSAKLTITIAD